MIKKALSIYNKKKIRDIIKNRKKSNIINRDVTCGNVIDVTCGNVIDVTCGNVIDVNDVTMEEWSAFMDEFDKPDDINPLIPGEMIMYK